MKKFYAILCIAIASLTQLQAQAPQGFNYQATVRNSAGDLIINTNVYFKFNVIQSSDTSVPIFTETHYVPTDDLGQVNLVIGQGTPSAGTFSELDWSQGSYYLGIELDTGNGYLAMGTTQLLSVPYALYAQNSGNATSATPNLEAVLAENNSANNQQIKDLQDPTEAQDAVTKNYAETQFYSQSEVDALVAEAIAGLQSQIDDLDTDNATLNQDLVGSWYGTSVDNSQPPTTEVIQITLESNGEGYTIFDLYDQNNNLIETSEYDVTWSSTPNTITINYSDYGPNGQQYIDSQTNSYEFIDTDSFRFFEDDGDVTIFYRSNAVTDQDGNTYDYLPFGDQLWTVQNAEMVTYRDGTPIPQVTDNYDWESLTTGAWSYYGNDPTKPRLYNWFAVMGIHDTASLLDASLRKEFAPEGWHVPSFDEWITLENYLIANGYNFDQTTTGNKIAKAMASTTGWDTMTLYGTVGNDQSLNNSSGFNIFPEGSRGYIGDFRFEGDLGLFWSSTDLGGNNARDLTLYTNERAFTHNSNGHYIYKQVGNSVRLVKDATSLSTTDFSNSIIIYPNPVKNILTIDGLVVQDVVIYSVLGKEVLKISNLNTIDVSSLSKGVYFIKVSDGINASTKKFIKN